METSPDLLDRFLEFDKIDVDVGGFKISAEGWTVGIGGARELPATGSVVVVVAADDVVEGVAITRAFALSGLRGDCRPLLTAGALLGI